MMTVSSTPDHWATQRATWAETESDGRVYTAAVTRSSHVQLDTRKRGWAYELGVSVPDGVGFHYTFARESELLWTHDTDPLDVLACLASFVGAWRESRQYGSESSDNWDMFPEACVPFLDGAELYELWAYEHEEMRD